MRARNHGNLNPHVLYDDLKALNEHAVMFIQIQVELQSVKHPDDLSQSCKVYLTGLLQLSSH